MAPEVYVPPHQHGTAAEYFSVGVTLHEFLTGTRPFPSNRFKVCVATGMPFAPVVLSSLRLGRISDHAIDFVEQLLEMSPLSRLGAVSGIEEIKAHPCVVNFDWDAISEKRVPAPIKPDLSYHKFDVGDSETQQAIEDHCKTIPITEEDQKKFSLFRLRDAYYSSLFLKSIPEDGEGDDKRKKTADSIAWTNIYEVDSSFHVTYALIDF
jgi:serine/threonine protein kinase